MKLLVSALFNKDPEKETQDEKKLSMLSQLFLYRNSNTDNSHDASKNSTEELHVEMKP